MHGDVFFQSPNTSNSFLLVQAARWLRLNHCRALRTPQKNSVHASRELIMNRIFIDLHIQIVTTPVEGVSMLALSRLAFSGSGMAYVFWGQGHTQP
jgi:hypothetical protein